MTDPNCVINPKTGRAVKTSGKLGQKILKEQQNVNKTPHTMYKKPIGPVKPKEPHTMYKKPIGPVKPKTVDDDIFSLMKKFNNDYSVSGIEKQLKNKEATRDESKKFVDLFTNRYEQINVLKDKIEDPIKWIKEMNAEQKKIVKEYTTAQKTSVLLKRFKLAKKS